MTSPGVSIRSMPTDTRLRALLYDAAWWRLLGRLFECPTESWRHDVARLAAEANDDELRAAADAAVATATEGAYHSVFGPGGPAPPREASYYDSLELGSLMSELAAYYDAFGYHPSIAEPPDHVAVEIGFMSYLRLKEAYALATGEIDHSEAASQAAARFCSDHLARLAAPLAGLLAESGIEHLVKASQRLAAHAGSPPTRRWLPVLQESSDDDGREFGCGDL